MEIKAFLTCPTVLCNRPSVSPSSSYTLTRKQYGVQNVIISSVLPRNKWFLQERARDLNKFLSELCKVHGFIFIDNFNILVDQHLYSDGVHLNDEGSIVLANNYLECLNGMHWEKVLGA